jgi:2-dehydropantoate 2-reductase
MARGSSLKVPRCSGSHFPTTNEGMSSVAIIGPGAIGGTIAAHLFNLGVHNVTLCVRTPFESLEVGLPDGTTLRANPRVLTSPAALSSPPEWLLVTTKAYDTAGAAAWIAALAGPNTRVAILQNGVEHIERFKPHVALERLLPVMVDLPAERDAPGRIRQRGRSVFRMPDNELGREFLGLLEGTGFDAATSDDFLSVIWRKLALNAPGAVNALLLQPTGIVRDPAIANLMRRMILEVIAVAGGGGARAHPKRAPKKKPSQQNSAARRQE